MTTDERVLPSVPRARLRRAIVIASVVVAACGDSTGPSDEEVSLEPTPENIAGAYSATVFTGGGFDVLALGGSLEMTLGSDGSVTGTMVIPEAAGGPLTADMAGTYTLVGNTLTITQDADTFVRDATWTWTNGVLNGSWSGSGTTVTVRMER